MAAGRIKGITIEIGGDTTKLTKALASVDSALSKTQANLKDVDKLLKLDPGNTELLRQKQGLLADAVSQTKDRLEQLQTAQSNVAKGSEEWDAIQREIIETEQKLDSLKKDVNDFGSVTAQKLKVVGEKFQEVGGKIESAGQKMSKISGFAAAALGGIAKLGYDAVTAADDLNTLSKQTGVFTDELQKWNYAADLIDVSTETMTGAMKKMKKNLDSNADAFESLGVKTKDSNGNFRDSTDIFYDTLEALSKISNETERDVAAMDIFGKSADDLAGVIDDGGQALKEYGQEAENLGLIIGQDTLDSLNEANDTIDRLKATVGASFAQAGATIAQTFAPALEKVAEVVGIVAERIRNLTPEQAELIVKILAVVAAISPVLIIIGKVTSGIGSLISVLAGISGPVLAVIAVVAALAAAFTVLYNNNEEFRNKVDTTFAGLQEKFQELWTTIQPALEEIGQVFQELMVALEPVFEFLIEMIAEVLDGVMEAVPSIIDAIQSGITFITEIVQAFTALFKGDFDGAAEHLKNAAKALFDYWKNIFKAGIDAIVGFFNHFGIDIKAKIQSIVTNIQTTWSNLVNSAKTNAQNVANSIINGIGTAISWIKSLPSQAWSWGADIIGGIADGIRAAISKVTDAVSSVADVIWSYLHFTEPDVGPLRNFHTFMPDMMREMVKGIDSGLPTLENAANKVANALVPNTLTNGVNQSSTANNTVNITVYGAQGQDVRELADIIQQRINSQVYNQRAVFA